MAPIVKDVENSAATTAPAASATKPPQPVALEVPVTVNGARTVDGSDKREPFSEPTKTVLIFGHGAVIRLASLVAPGQLLFVTNEKTKKEVVCQVVKSKNYRTVTGYVELEFTEPAVGFWGMRFPTDRVLPAPATSTGSVVPMAHSPAQYPAVSAPSAVPTPPKIAPAPPAPAAMKPAAPAPVPVKPVATAPPVAPPLAKPLPPKPQQPVASHSASPVASHPAPSAPPVPPVFAETVASKPPVTPAASTSPNTETTSPAQQSPQTIPAIPSANPTTDELKQHTARLQEQLSSMLFTEAPATKAPAPEKPTAPKQDMTPSETVQKILQLSQPEVKPPSPVAPLPETRPTPASVKSVPVSMAVEEVKIPAWLAPLARETDALPAEATVEEPAIAEANTSSAATQQEALPLEGDAASTKIQHPMFGEQLFGTSSEGAPTRSSGGSKKGLLIGLAAAGLLVIGGGAWYAKKPGNAVCAETRSHAATDRSEFIRVRKQTCLSIRNRRRRRPGRTFFESATSFQAAHSRSTFGVELGRKFHCHPRRLQGNHFRVARRSACRRTAEEARTRGSAFGYSQRESSRELRAKAGTLLRRSTRASPPPARPSPCQHRIPKNRRPRFQSAAMWCQPSCSSPFPRFIPRPPARSVSVATSKLTP